MTAPDLPEHYIDNTRSTPGRINECKSINPPSGVPDDRRELIHRREANREPGRGREGA